MPTLVQPQNRLQALRSGDDTAWREFFEEFDPLIVSVVGWPKWRFSPPVREDLCQVMRQAIVQSIANLRSEGRPQLQAA